jgi:hypothetical protein
MPAITHDDPPRPNRMMQRPPMTMEMDLLGLRRRHDPEPFITIIDTPTSKPKEDSMYTISNRTLGLKDNQPPAGDQSANWAAVLALLEEQAAKVDPTSRTAGALASIATQVRLMMAQDQQPQMDQTALLQQARHVRLSQAMVDRVARGEEENRQKAVAAAWWRSQRGPAYDPDHAKVY